MVTNYEIISKEAISPSEVLEAVEKKGKEKELTYREEKISEFLRKNHTLSLEDYKKAKEELEALEIPRIENEHIIKILEILPRNGTELRAITSNTGVVIVDDVANQILEVVKKYL